MAQRLMDLSNQSKKMKNKPVLILMSDEYRKMLKEIISAKSKDLNYSRRVTATEIILHGIQLAYNKQLNKG